jgi:hypothetical protein
MVVDALLQSCICSLPSDCSFVVISVDQRLMKNSAVYQHRILKDYHTTTPLHTAMSNSENTPPGEDARGDTENTQTLETPPNFQQVGAHYALMFIIVIIIHSAIHSAFRILGIPTAITHILVLDMLLRLALWYIPQDAYYQVGRFAGMVVNEVVHGYTEARHAGEMIKEKDVKVDSTESTPEKKELEVEKKMVESTPEKKEPEAEKKPTESTPEKKHPAKGSPEKQPGTPLELSPETSPEQLPVYANRPAAGTSSLQSGIPTRATSMGNMQPGPQRRESGGTVRGGRRLPSPAGPKPLKFGKE